MFLQLPIGTTIPLLPVSARVICQGFLSRLIISVFFQWSKRLWLADFGDFGIVHIVCPQTFCGFVIGGRPSLDVIALAVLATLKCLDSQGTCCKPCSSLAPALQPASHVHRYSDSNCPTTIHDILLFILDFKLSLWNKCHFLQENWYLWVIPKI